MKYKPTLLKIEPPTPARRPSRRLTLPGLSSPPNAMSRSVEVHARRELRPIKLVDRREQASRLRSAPLKKAPYMLASVC